MLGILVYMGIVKQPVNGQYQVLNIQLPSQIKVYNQGMGGIDLGDQYASYYNFHHQSWNWMRRIYAHFFLVAARNAHILYKDAYQELSQFLDFLKILVTELMGLEVVDLDAEGDGEEEEDSQDEDGQDEDSQDEDSLDDSEIESEDDVPPPVRRRTAGWLSDEGWAKRHDSRGHHLRKIVFKLEG